VQAQSLTVYSGRHVAVTANLTITGDTYIDSTGGTAGRSSLSGAVSTDALTVYAGEDITLGAVTASGIVTLDNSLYAGDVILNGALQANSLDARPTDVIKLGDDVTTTTTQSYNAPVTLLGDVILTGAGITLDKVDGAFGLTIDDSGTLSLGNAIGLVQPLTSLSVTTGSALTINQASITTSQNLSVAVTSGDLTLSETLVSETGTITLTASNDVHLSAAASAQANSGNITISASEVYVASGTGAGLSAPNGEVQITFDASGNASNTHMRFENRAIDAQNITLRARNAFNWLLGQKFTDTFGLSKADLQGLNATETLTLTDIGTGSGTMDLRSGFSLAASDLPGNLTLKYPTISGNANASMALAADKTLTLSNTSNSTFASLVSGSTNLAKQGSGGLAVTANNTYTGTTSVQSGTLTVGVGGTSGTLGTGSIDIVAGELIVSRSGDVTLANAISGAGALRHTGAGTLTLSGQAIRWLDTSAQWRWGDI
jgi:autotransporter-associated beta strand protein